MIDMTQSDEETPPSLPPRPALAEALSSGSLRLSRKSSRPQLLSQATTALSLADVHTQSRLESSSLRSSPGSRSISRKHSFTHSGRAVNGNNSEGDDSVSLKSYAPTHHAKVDDDILIGEIYDQIAALRDTRTDVEPTDPDPELDDFVLHEDEVLESQIGQEFTELGDISNGDEEAGLRHWQSRLKHFFILSASGKPIYSRHGDDHLIGNYIGIVQTLLAFYEGADDSLKSFTAGDVRFVILGKGPLNLVAISRIGESASHLRTQLEALYMQILSTLTLPKMEKMFSNRPSTDLRRPLQGTDVLLDGLADGFTRGSPAILLSALECLRLRASDRNAINEALLAVRAPELLYGLVVAAGRLVSVARPKKHSLHPGDLHLIFNMLFEAGGVKAGGGENWIPLCLPGFNNTGYVYMYVSFLPTAPVPKGAENGDPSSNNSEDDLAIILISPSKEAFYSLRTMRDAFLGNLRKSHVLVALHNAISKPRPNCEDILGNTILKHFLYKSRGNVQYTMSSLEPNFSDIVARRKLLTLYGALHDNIHSRNGQLKVQHIMSTTSTALAWQTPLFELYCVAGPHAPRDSLAHGANRVVQWIRREEDRVFIIGGAVF